VKQSRGQKRRIGEEVDEETAEDLEAQAKKRRREGGGQAVGKERKRSNRRQ